MVHPFMLYATAFLNSFQHLHTPLLLPKRHCRYSDGVCFLRGTAISIDMFSTFDDSDYILNNHLLLSNPFRPSHDALDNQILFRQRYLIYIHQPPHTQHLKKNLIPLAPYHTPIEIAYVIIESFKTIITHSPDGVFGQTHQNFDPYA